MGLFDFLSPSSSSTANNEQAGLETMGGESTAVTGNRGTAAVGGAVVDVRNVKVNSAYSKLKKGPAATQPSAQGNGTTQPTVNTNSGGVQTITTINTPDDNAINAIQDVAEASLAVSDDENNAIIESNSTLAAGVINSATLLATNAQNQSAEISEAATTLPNGATALQGSPPVSTVATTATGVSSTGLIILLGLVVVTYVIVKKG
jgi:hypothetical protein